MRTLSILLVEPEFVLRRTIVALARDFGLGSIHDVTSPQAAATLLAARRLDGLVLDLASETAAFDLLARLRASQFASDPGMPVIGLTTEPRDRMAPRVAPFGLIGLLTKPFKIAELLNAMQRIEPPAVAGVSTD